MKNLKLGFVPKACDTKNTCLVKKDKGRDLRPTQRSGATETVASDVSVGRQELPILCKDFSGIYDLIGVEGGFDLFGQFDTGFAKLLLQIFGFGYPNSMLTGEGPTQF